MSIVSLINLLFNFNMQIINNYIQKNLEVYKYQEMKEIRYIYFYNTNNFDISDIDIYVGKYKLEYEVKITDYYKIDLENYYPLDSIKIINNNNLNFSIKYSNIDDISSSFAHTDIDNFDSEINIDDLIIDNPEWSNIKYSNKKINATKTIKLIE